MGWRSREWASCEIMVDMHCMEFEGCGHEGIFCRKDMVLDPSGSLRGSPVGVYRWSLKHCSGQIWQDVTYINDIIFNSSIFLLVWGISCRMQHGNFKTTQERYRKLVETLDSLYILRYLVRDMIRQNTTCYKMRLVESW